MADRVNPLGLSAAPSPSTSRGAGDSPYAEIGSSGLKQSAGFIREEFLQELQGPRGMKKYREMEANSSVIGSCLAMITMLIRQVKWHVEPCADAEAADIERAAFLESCLHDMAMPWTEVVSEHLSMLPYGWAWSEVVYKTRGGDGADSSTRSKYSDGLVGWRKIALRGQDTLQSWDLDPNGGIRGMRQLDPNSGRGIVYIPIEKSLLVRPRAERNNPEGRSILRNAYFPWYFLKRIAETEGIGIERDLNGLPVFEIPARCMSPDASPQDKLTRTAAEDIVKNIRNDQEEGVVIGQEFDNGQPRYKLSLLTSGGRRNFDTNTIIRRYTADIAQTMLHDLVLMGQPNTIQYRGTSLPNLFAIALGGWLDVIAEVYNSFAVPRLWRLNGWPTDRAARLCHGEIQAPDLGPLGDFLSKIFAAGFKWANDDDVDEHLRRAAKVPRRNRITPPAPASFASSTPQERVEAAGSLVRAGYDPVDAARLVGLDIKHLGHLPVTVQPAASKDVSTEDPPPSPAPPAPDDEEEEQEPVPEPDELPPPPVPDDEEED